MFTSTATPSTKPNRGDYRRNARHGKVAIILMLAAGAICTAAFLGIRLWPFKPTSVIQALQEASDSHVQIRAFHNTYFPYPGCTLDGVVFARGNNATKPLITIEKLTIRGTYVGIVTHHLSRINAEGMRVLE
jgi:hypothetical protein